MFIFEFYYDNYKILNEVNLDEEFWKLDILASSGIYKFGVSISSSSFTEEVNYGAII